MCNITSFTITLVLATIFGTSGVSQFSSFITFEETFSPYDNEIIIGSNSSDSLWQVGEPHKTYFSEARSLPNALMTDTINPYPKNTSASFTAVMPHAVNTFPNYQFAWFQKSHAEYGFDGCIVEASYDKGNKWQNVFNDPEYRPLMVGSYRIDTLHNGIVGMTGISDWSYVGACWGTSFGTQPELEDTLMVRFTFISDGFHKEDEGWMFDNFEFTEEIIGVAISTPDVLPLNLYPNPSSDFIMIDLDQIENAEAELSIYSSDGFKIHVESIFPFRHNRFEKSIVGYLPGAYVLRIETDNKVYVQRFVKF